MGNYNHRSSSAAAILLIALLFTASNPTANSQLLTLKGFSVGGSLCCTPTGNCPGLPVSGATASVKCPNLFGVSTTVGTGNTNTNGVFNVTVPALTGLLLALQPFGPCVVVVQLPLAPVICPLLANATGALVAAVNAAEGLVNTAVGLLPRATVTGFVNVTISP